MKTINLIKEYANIEAAAVNDFIRIAFIAEAAGHEAIKKHYIEEAKEDIEHSMLLVELLSSINEELEPTKAELDENIFKIKEYKDYLTYFVGKEQSAVEFSSNIFKVANEEGRPDLAQAILKFVEMHREELMEAQEMLDKFEQSGSILEFENWLLSK